MITALAKVGKSIVSALRKTSDYIDRVIIVGPSRVDGPNRLPSPVDVTGLVVLINDIRTNLGLGTLEIRPRLQISAQSWADTIAKANNLDHGGMPKRFVVCPDRVSPEIGKEELAKAIIDHMMSQVAHRDMMLGKFTGIGSGKSMSIDKLPYFVLDFEE